MTFPTFIFRDKKRRDWVFIQPRLNVLRQDGSVYLKQGAVNGYFVFMSVWVTT